MSDILNQITSSKEIIVAIVTGVFSLLGILLKINRESKLNRVTDERRKWRKEIRNIAEGFSTINMSSMDDIAEQVFMQLLIKLKMRINTYGKYSKDCLKDCHIWKSISILEDKEKRTEKQKNKLIDYLSLLLKYDWERSKIEASTSIIEILGYCIYIASNVLFVYFAYTDFVNTNIPAVIELILIFAGVFFFPLLILTGLKMLKVNGYWGDLFFSYIVPVLILSYVLYKNANDEGYLNSLTIPIVLQIVALFLLGLSKIPEFKNYSDYKSTIRKIEENFHEERNEEKERVSVDNNENKLGYLQLIQEPICRMSTISAISKGFAATIVAGVSVISYSEIHFAVLGLSFLPVVAFAIIDIYYLILERKFRFLYNEVAEDKHVIDYSLKLNLSEDEKRTAKATIWQCIKSPSIWLFYPILIVILIIVFILKCCCVI